MFELLDHNFDDSNAGTRDSAPGRVRFDERGNAIYAWSNAQLASDGKQAERLRERALLNPSLALVNEDPSPNMPVMRNDKGLRVGYNPYESGQLSSKQAGKKCDMRELSKWIEMKRRLKTQSNSDSNQ